MGRSSGSIKIELKILLLYLSSVQSDDVSCDNWPMCTRRPNLCYALRKNAHFYFIYFVQVSHSALYTLFRLKIAACTVSAGISMQVQKKTKISLPIPFVPRSFIRLRTNTLIASRCVTPQAMPLTRSQKEPEPPRPRRKAAAVAAARPLITPPLSRGTVWTDAKGLRLVGTVISIYWQPDDEYYPAMVLSYNRRKRTHKVIYFEDETIEVLDLGTGPEQRQWKVGPPMSDPLVGKEILLLKEQNEDEGWFEFMRGPREKKEPDLVVIVLSNLNTPPDEDEISHPLSLNWHDANALHKLYRTVYVANEFLATVDLEHIRYKVLGEDEDEEDAEREGHASQRGRSALPLSSQRLASRAAAEDDDDDESVGKDVPYVPPDLMEEDEDDDDASGGEENRDIAMDADIDDDLRKNLDGVTRTPLRTRIIAKSEYINKNDRGKDSLQKTVTADRDGARIDEDPSNMLDTYHDNAVERKADAIIRTLAGDDDDVQGGMGMKSRGEGSVATQETHDDPLEPNGTSRKGEKEKISESARGYSYTQLFDEDEDGHTASDEENLGWVSAKREQPAGSRSQVGDYVSLIMGSGKPNRKAFVEAYMPDADKHFLAFCDTEGGNLQIKLTEQNHTVLKDEEVDELNRAQSLDVRNEEQNLPRFSKRRRLAVNLTDSRTRRRREVKTPPVRGERAGTEVCGRCLKIVWPGSDMVYTALVLGYDKGRDEHQVVYLSDQCVETMELKYREWNLLSRDDEPWISQGMLGKRLYIYWEGEYESPGDQVKAKELFGDDVKVPYEAYVLSYEGDGKYMIIYPNSEDKEVRDLKTDGTEDIEEKDRDWGLLKLGQTEVNGLPVVGWEP